jgi:hypothetical protein
LDSFSKFPEAFGGYNNALLKNKLNTSVFCSRTLESAKKNQDTRSLVLLSTDGKERKKKRTTMSEPALPA